MNTYWPPHLEMSPKCFTMATKALFCAFKQIHCALVVCNCGQTNKNDLHQTHSNGSRLAAGRPQFSLAGLCGYFSVRKIYGWSRGRSHPKPPCRSVKHWNRWVTARTPYRLSYCRSLHTVLAGNPPQTLASERHPSIRSFVTARSKTMCLEHWNIAFSVRVRARTYAHIRTHASTHTHVRTCTHAGTCARARKADREGGRRKERESQKESQPPGWYQRIYLLSV